MKTSALIVTPIYPTPENRQAGIFVHRQVLNLMREGVSCRVLLFRPAPPPFPKWLVRRSWLRHYWKQLGRSRMLDGVPVEQVFYPRRWVAGEDVIPSIADSLGDFIEARGEYRETDVIYAQWLWTGGAAALLLRERFGWPVAAIARGSEMHDWQSAHPHCRAYVEKVIREADRLLTNCEDLRERAEAMVSGARARAEVIYNGCDHENFRPAEDKAAVRRKLGLDARAKIMLFCGAVTSRKGVLELAEAWDGFGSSHPDWSLVVVGQGVEKPLVEKLRQAGCGRVFIVGQVSHERVREYLQAADAYVQPSRLEGLANATMEAMAVGLPVITTDTCGQRELIRDGENGWLVPPGQAAALAGALDVVAKDMANARSLGQAARRTIEKQFDPRKEAARLVEVLRDTARKSKAASASVNVTSALELSAEAISNG